MLISYNSCKNNNSNSKNNKKQQHVSVADDSISNALYLKASVVLAFQEYDSSLIYINKAIELNPNYGES